MSAGFQPQTAAAIVGGFLQELEHQLAQGDGHTWLEVRYRIADQWQPLVDALRAILEREEARGVVPRELLQRLVDEVRQKRKGDQSLVDMVAQTRHEPRELFPGGLIDWPALRRRDEQRAAELAAELALPLEQQIRRLYASEAER